MEMYKTREELEEAMAGAEDRLKARLGDQMEQRLFVVKDAIEDIAVAMGKCCRTVALYCIAKAMEEDKQIAVDAYLVLIKRWEAG